MSRENSSDNGAKDIFVTFTIANQLFGIPVLLVQDILGPQKITRVPLAPKEVLGSLNLRGRIVTAIDVRIRLGLATTSLNDCNMSIVVDHNGELYSLVVDSVGEVMTLPPASHEKNPATLDAQWQEVSNGIYHLDHNLMVVLDVIRLLHLNHSIAA